MLTPQQFISEIASGAVSFYCTHRISAALIIAQGALESGWGKTAAAMGNNIFGIKADPSWHGPTTTQQTKEYVNGQWITVTAKFRAYPSIQACLEDHDGFLLQSRYANLVGVDYKTACHLIASVDHYATDPTYEMQLLEIINEYGLAKYDDKGACSTVTTYPRIPAQLNGTQVDAIAVGNATYLIWTAAKLTGANVTKVDYGDVEIDGKKGPQVTQGGNTYLLWSSIPTVDAHPVKDEKGIWQFKTVPTPAPVAHNYTLVVTEDASEIVGTFATIAIYTLDNGQPLGHQLITISENGAQVASDYSDATSGSYGWGITETENKTDTMTVTWRDPAGVTHTSTHTTTFIVPQPSDAPVPSDDNVVVRIPMLPTSDASDAVFFNMTAPSGESIQCQLDTGAFEAMFTTVAATALGLKNEGNVTVQGVGGSASAYYSHASFSLNGVSFSQVPCVVEDAFQGYPLFGYRFFVDNGYDLLVSQKHNQIVIMKATA